MKENCHSNQLETKIKKWGLFAFSAIKYRTYLASDVTQSSNSNDITRDLVFLSMSLVSS